MAFSQGRINSAVRMGLRCPVNFEVSDISMKPGDTVTIMVTATTRLVNLPVRWFLSPILAPSPSSMQM
ncbi:hypothetical protein FRB95_005269 [Tulasnella sp. JGI-2019a]|nr:hypothetical protein FRB95_005269 [Tulasnella sp. JGI-2019a]